MRFDYTIFCALSMILVLALVNSMLSIPDVQFSYATNECLKVLNYTETDSYSCESLPSRFNHVWVE
jgi:hypothetical protein